jgi:hypothetical protein
MRRVLGIAAATGTMLLALLLVSRLPRVMRVEDLTESGAGLELGEWQAGVGIALTAAILLGILAVFLLRVRFPLGLMLVSSLTFGLVAAIWWFLRSAKARTGVINEHGHGLTYDAWQASVIPWTIALVLVGLCAVASLTHWLLGIRAQRKAEQP